LQFKANPGKKLVRSHLKTNKLDLMGHICESQLGGRRRRISLRPALGKNIKSYPKNRKQKRAGGMDRMIECLSRK
jgi:hypothetical protein